ncbi:hypothetical protein AXF42_Ash013344 [Apostasia shenzhenica]|uniref:Uncharacterized protein n=1 Tax=Apostasia shenzhenica TaxID=1088818 RepID=A0A2I0BBQ4_9ASPA|nr:hypothetical protein AXF42_Ash013344 [Apostasia shenzhenica]
MLGVHITRIKNSPLQGLVSNNGGRYKSLAKSSSFYSNLHIVSFPLFANSASIENWICDILKNSKKLKLKDCNFAIDLG